ncbi:MAG: hypothetical protein K5776_09945 [Lachnospiraceae bacterium]|nr:hypothetical protein [Lachnospiraceae bacterium]
MKKMYFLASAAIALSLCACAGEKLTPAELPKEEIITQSVEEVPAVTEDEPEVEQEEVEINPEEEVEDKVSEPIASIKFTWDTANVTNSDPTKMTEFDDVSDLEIINTDRGDDKLNPGELFEVKDADGNVIYDELYTIDGDIRIYVCNIYSKNADGFTVEAQPIALQSAVPDYNSTFEIIKKDGESVTKDGEEMIVRSYTGHHFIGLFTVKNGEVLDWEMPEYMKDGFDNID